MARAGHTPDCGRSFLSAEWSPLLRCMEPQEIDFRQPEDRNLFFLYSPELASSSQKTGIWLWFSDLWSKLVSRLELSLKWHVRDLWCTCRQVHALSGPESSFPNPSHWSFCKATPDKDLGLGVCSVLGSEELAQPNRGWKNPEDAVL